MPSFQNLSICLYSIIKCQDRKPYSTALEGLVLTQILVSTSLAKLRMFKMAAASTYLQLTRKYIRGNPGVLHTAKPWHERR